jgi:NADPH-dependent 2,4-dienoyl-CoA reductase/sulfur reductase-like enzyme
MRLLVVGGSDAGIQAGLRALERDPAVEVTVLVADRYPNYSICGIPYRSLMVTTARLWSGDP